MSLPAYNIIFLIYSVISFLGGEAQARSMALLGDNLIAGYVAHPDFSWTEMKPLSSSPETPTLLPPDGVRDYRDSAFFVLHNVIFHLLARYANSPRYSFGYFVAQSQQVAVSDVLVPAVNNSKMTDLLDQTDRVLRYLAYRPPHYAIVFFADGELCSPYTGTNAQGLEQGLKYLVRNSRSSGYSPLVIVPALPAFGQFLHVEELLQKKISFAGSTMTCSELRAKRMPEPVEVENLFSLMLGRLLVQNPARFCPGLFAVFTDAKGQEEHITSLANRVRAYRTAQESVVSRVQAWADTNYSARRFRFVYVEGTATIEFKADDVTADCFHLSVAGQRKLAEPIIAAMAKVNNEH